MFLRYYNRIQSHFKSWNQAIPVKRKWKSYLFYLINIFIAHSLLVFLLMGLSVSVFALEPLEDNELTPIKLVLIPVSAGSMIDHIEMINNHIEKSLQNVKSVLQHFTIYDPNRIQQHIMQFIEESSRLDIHHLLEYLNSKLIVDFYLYSEIKAEKMVFTLYNVKDSEELTREIPFTTIDELYQANMVDKLTQHLMEFLPNMESKSYTAQFIQSTLENGDILFQRDGDFEASYNTYDRGLRFLEGSLYRQDFTNYTVQLSQKRELSRQAMVEWRNQQEEATFLWTYINSGIAGATLLTGIVLFGLSDYYFGKGEDVYTNYLNASITTEAIQLRQEVQDYYDLGNNLVIGGSVMMGAAVIAAAIAGYFWWDTQDDLNTIWTQIRTGNYSYSNMDIGFSMQRFQLAYSFRY